MTTILPIWMNRRLPQKEGTLHIPHNYRGSMTPLSLSDVSLNHFSELSQTKPRKNVAHINYKLRFFVYFCLVMATAMTLFASFHVVANQITPQIEEKIDLNTTQVSSEKSKQLAYQPSLQTKVNDQHTKQQLFIIDSSHLISKPELALAKQVLIKALLQLTPDDRFNIIEVRNTPHRLFSHSQRATFLSVAEAISFVDGLTIGGPANLLPAMQLAISTPTPSDISTSQIVLLSNGQLEYQRVARYIHQYIGDKQLFLFAIGHKVHVSFMAEIAHASKGTSHAITDDLNVNKTIANVLQQLNSFHGKNEISPKSTTPIALSEDKYAKEAEDKYAKEENIMVPQQPGL